MTQAMRTPLTREQFRIQVQAFQGMMDASPSMRDAMTTLCGSAETLDALMDPRGVGIGQFAALMNLPSTTVRHLLREGLLHPYRLGARFVFFVQNVIELRGVQQWQGLGLTLEETRDFIQAQDLVGMLMEADQDGTRLMTVSHTQPHPPGPAQVQELQLQALERIQAANARLNEKKRALEEQLARGQSLEEALRTTLQEATTSVE